jgi:hypothetical protein
MIRPKNFTNNFLAESSHKLKARGQKKNIFIFIGRIIEIFNRPNHSIFSTGRIVYHQKIIRPKVQKCFWPNRTVFFSAYCNIFVVLSEKPQFYFVLRINVDFYGLCVTNFEFNGILKAVMRTSPEF